MFSAIIDLRSGRMDYCQAGYPSPLSVTTNRKVKLVGDGGFPVGMLIDAAFENDSFDLEDGSLLVFCSDAALEAENADEVPFGPDRLHDLVQNNFSVSFDKLPDLITTALLNWRAGKSLEDDLTILALKRTISNDSNSQTQQ
jgi:phosphoserine phosphatase RsbU/P